MDEHKSISLVVPAFNEEEACDLFIDRVVPIMENLGLPFEIIFVDDGSSDATFEKLKARSAADSRIRGIRFSRNFGQQLALTAGIYNASGDAVITIDCDLQHPPEFIPTMVQHWQQGAEIAVAVRAEHKSYSWFRKVTTQTFYRIMHSVSEVPLPPNAGSFRLIDRKVVEALKMLPERARYMKGLYAWVGYRTVYLPCAFEKRTVGVTKYKFWKLWRYALDGLLSFSTLPLRIWTYVGLLVSMSAVLYGSYILIDALTQDTYVPGYASLFVGMLLMNGLVLIGVGVMGEYVGRVFHEVKGRPLYVIWETVGFDKVNDRDDRS